MVGGGSLPVLLVITVFIEIATVFIGWIWKMRRTVPFDKAGVATGAIAGEVFAIGTHRSALGNLHTELVIGW
jgi:hypothetical protein